MNKAAANSQRGFTLVEVLVAVAITAVIAMLAYRSIDVAARGVERSAEVIQEMNGLDRAYSIIAADLRHALAPEAGPTGLRFLFRAESLNVSPEEGQWLMRFTRRGWVNPLERLRSDIQELGYRLEEGTLWRYYRPMRNKPYDEYDFEEEALEQRLLDDVKDIQLRFLSLAMVNQNGLSALEGTEYTRDWATEWPDPNLMVQGLMPLPLAVEVRIELEGLGVSSRLFEIVAP